MDRAYALLDTVVSNPKVDAPTLMTIVEWYRQLSNFPKIEAVMARMVQLQPQAAEAWYDLASIRTSLGRPTEGMTALSNALTLSVARRTTNPTAIDLVAEAKKDARLEPLRSRPDFRKLVPQ
jgi:thioredoxin-like negative regulator of GroEL